MGENSLPGGKGDGVKRHPRQNAHNSAPPASGTNPLVTSAEALRFARSQKHNPLPDLKPAMLVRVLDAFEHGYIREAVLLWEKIAERDDTLVSVKPKREKAVSQLDRQIVKLDESPEADEHEAVLKDFWDNVRCYNSYDRNERGGFRRLVKQMMSAVSFRYAVHHIIWQPRPDGTLRATFEFVPLWQFENRTGRLRYLPHLSALEGTILADGEWMTTVGDGLMIACCIGYLAKRSAYNDWLIFSEKFSVPGVMGRTTGRKDSPEGQAMRQAVESFGHDWTAVIYGDDGTHQEPLKLIQAAGNPTAMPMPAVIERVDRKFATIYRGADLSTMSSNSGEGTGASLQEKETDILMRDDAEMISETLEDISRMVIEWHFGHGTEPKARVELVVPVAEDAGKVIENGIKLADAGADVSISALMDRAGLPVAKDEADRLGAAKPQTQDGKSQDSRQEAAANADVPSYYDPRDYPGDEPARPEWLDALADDMQPLGKALAGAMRAGDEEAVKAALKKLSDRMPDFMETPGLEAWMEGEMAKALIGDDEDVENAYNPNQPRYPKGHGSGGQWTDDPEHGGNGIPYQVERRRRREAEKQSGGKIKWTKRPGDSVMAPLTYSDDYTISERPGRNTLTHKVGNKHIGTFGTLADAQAAAEKHHAKFADLDLPEGARGIRRAVDDYKELRKLGDHPLMLQRAKALRDQIKADIKKFNLDPDKIWGDDPERKSVEDRYAVAKVSDLDLEDSYRYAKARKTPRPKIVESEWRSAVDKEVTLKGGETGVVSSFNIGSHDITVYVANSKGHPKPVYVGSDDIAKFKTVSKPLEDVKIGDAIKTKDGWQNVNAYQVLPEGATFEGWHQYKTAMGVLAIDPEKHSTITVRPKADL